MEWLGPPPMSFAAPSNPSMLQTQQQHQQQHRHSNSGVGTILPSHSHLHLPHDGIQQRASAPGNVGTSPTALPPPAAPPPSSSSKRSNHRKSASDTFAWAASPYLQLNQQHSHHHSQQQFSHQHWSDPLGVLSTLGPGAGPNATVKKEDSGLLTDDIWELLNQEGEEDEDMDHEPSLGRIGSGTGASSGSAELGLALAGSSKPSQGPHHHRFPSDPTCFTTIGRTGKPMPNFTTQTRANALDPAQLDPKRAKRIIANRQSAHRSRMKKLRTIHELEKHTQAVRDTVAAMYRRAEQAFSTRRELLKAAHTHRNNLRHLQQQIVYQQRLQAAARAELQLRRQAGYIPTATHNRTASATLLPAGSTGGIDPAMHPNFATSHGLPNTLPPQQNTAHHASLLAGQQQGRPMYMPQPPTMPPTVAGQYHPHHHHQGVPSSPARRTSQGGGHVTPGQMQSPQQHQHQQVAQQHMAAGPGLSVQRPAPPTTTQLNMSGGLDSPSVYFAPGPDPTPPGHPQPQYMMTRRASADGSGGLSGRRRSSGLQPILLPEPALPPKTVPEDISNLMIDSPAVFTLAGNFLDVDFMADLESPMIKPETDLVAFN